jgi:Flp pilus assembly protein TadD
MSEALHQGIAHHQAGRLAEAERCYRQVLAVEPNHPDALHLLGVIAYQVKQWRPAVELISRADALRPDVRCTTTTWQRPARRRRARRGRRGV